MHNGCAYRVETAWYNLSNFCAHSYTEGSYSAFTPTHLWVQLRVTSRFIAFVHNQLFAVITVTFKEAAILFSTLSTVLVITTVVVK